MTLQSDPTSSNTPPDLIFYKNKKDLTDMIF